MASSGTLVFDDLSLERLRQRRSAKWTGYPADVLPAWVAEMDFPLAEPVKAALQAAVERDDCGYTNPQDQTLGETFAAYAEREYGWVVDPSAVVPTTDVMTGVAEVIRRLVRPGEGVLINPPVYPPFFTTITQVGARVVEAPLGYDDGRWELDLDAIERGFAGGARAFLLCNPHNPTGRVFPAAQLHRVAELAARYDAWVLADEIHAPLVLPEAAHQPFVALGGEAARRGVTFASASKGWNLAGLKCAVMVTEPGAMRQVIGRIPVETRYHTGYLGVLASCAAWRDGGRWLDDVLRTLDRNRTLLADLLAEHLPNVGYQPPQASYLAWLDCRGVGLGEDPAAAFLEHGRVALSSGPTFGSAGAGFARLNIATSAGLMAEAVSRMATAVRCAPAVPLRSPRRPPPPG